ncbi:Sensor protein GacS [Durusdinium trenchii]|uniref:Sensor protein GacS n=1 Tax=Durusdinium trenchii TaxID=1381693 RepID=A0ABP0IBN6_9DINO
MLSFFRAGAPLPHPCAPASSCPSCAAQASEARPRVQGQPLTADSGSTGRALTTDPVKAARKQSGRQSESTEAKGRRGVQARRAAARPAEGTSASQGTGDPGCIAGAVQPGGLAAGVPAWGAACADVERRRRIFVMLALPENAGASGGARDVASEGACGEAGRDAEKGCEKEEQEWPLEAQAGTPCSENGLEGGTSFAKHEAAAKSRAGTNKRTSWRGRWSADWMSKSWAACVLSLWIFPIVLALILSLRSVASEQSERESALEIAGRSFTSTAQRRMRRYGEMALTMKAMVEKDPTPFHLGDFLEMFTHVANDLNSRLRRVSFAGLFVEVKPDRREAFFDGATTFYLENNQTTEFPVLKEVQGTLFVNTAVSSQPGLASPSVLSMQGIVSVGIDALAAGSLLLSPRTSVHPADSWAVVWFAGEKGSEPNGGSCSWVMIPTRAWVSASLDPTRHNNMKVLLFDVTEPAEEHLLAASEMDGSGKETQLEEQTALRIHAGALESLAQDEVGPRNGPLFWTETFGIGGRVFRFSIITSEEYLKIPTTRYAATGIALSLFLVLVTVLIFQRLRHKHVHDKAIQETRDKLLRFICHELRGPTHSLQCIMDELVPDPAAPGAFQLRLHGQAILVHLASLLDDFLDLSKNSFMSLKVKPIPTNVSNLARDTLLENKVLNAKPGVLTFRINTAHELDSCVLNVDPQRVRQILSNGFSNAIKYTERGEICLTLELDRNETPAAVVFTLSDTGRGLGNQDPEYLFKEFAQGEIEQVSSKPSTGLGLPIARQFAERMGGSLTLSNRTDGVRGVNFVLKLPHKPVNRVLNNPQTESNSQPLRGCKVHVVVAAPSSECCSIVELCRRLGVTELTTGPAGETLVQYMLRCVAMRQPPADVAIAVLESDDAQSLEGVALARSVPQSDRLLTLPCMTMVCVSPFCVNVSAKQILDLGVDSVCFEASSADLLAKELGTLFDPDEGTTLFHRKIRVLACEDEPLLQRFLTKRLEEDFAPGSLAYPDGLDVIEHLARRDAFVPDVLMCDIVMKRSSGDEVMHKLRTELGCTIPSVAVTGNCTAQDIESLKRAGFDMVLPKPYRRALLSSAAIKVFLERRRAALQPNDQP